VNAVQAGTAEKQKGPSSLMERLHSATSH